MKDRIDVYTDKGDIVIRMPPDAARELVMCFRAQRVTNPPVAKKIHEALVAQVHGFDYKGWVEKRHGVENEEDQKAADKALQGRKASEGGEESKSEGEGSSEQAIESDTVAEVEG